MYDVKKKKKILMDLWRKHIRMQGHGNLDSIMHVCVLARAEHSYSMWMERCREERFLFVFSIFADRPHVRPNPYFFRVFEYGKEKEKKKNILLYFVSSKQKLKISKNMSCFFSKCNKC